MHFRSHGARLPQALALGRRAPSIAAQDLISVIISCCTIVSSLLTARLVRRLGTGKLIALSVALTAGAILGFSATSAFWQPCLIAIPYGLGAGAIDSALNNHVALNYGARHMSWLHCCRGIGASAGPLVMGWVLASPLSWHAGYLAIGFIQAAIAAVLLFSLPLRRTTGTEPANGDGGDAPAPASSGRPRSKDALNGQALPTGMTDARPPLDRPLTNRELLKLPGAVASIVALTPKRFGAKASQGLVSLQMACAYAGSMLVPPVFEIAAGAGGAALIPIAIVALLVTNTALAELAVRKTKAAVGNATR